MYKVQPLVKALNIISKYQQKLVSNTLTIDSSNKLLKDLKINVSNHLKNNA